MDFEASGLAGLWVCSTRDRRAYDAGATDDRQSAGVAPYPIIEGSWTGANLFTADVTSHTFLGIAAVIACASRPQHTNFRFTCVGEGIAASCGEPRCTK
jgi:hypothetical protein